MQIDIKSILDELIESEGGYVNDPSDSGGETKYGITKRVARENGYNGSMSLITKDKALSIYEEIYYKKPGFDKLEKYLSFTHDGESILKMLLHFGVVAGTARCVKNLQSLLNVANCGGTHWANIHDDGVIGDQSFEAFTRMVTVYGTTKTKILIRTFILNHFYQVCLVSGKNERFYRGWVNRFINIE